MASKPPSDAPPADAPVSMIDETTPNYEGITLLLKHLGMEADDVNNVGRGVAGATVELSDGTEYAVLTDQEAEDWAKEDVESLLDDIGISGFNVNIEDFLENPDDFKDAMMESYQSYIEDIATEPASSDEYDSRLAEEMARAGVGSEAEFLDYLVGDQDPVEYVKENFGEEEVKRIAIVDSAKLAEEVINVDGRGHVIATYDGDEIELGEDWFAYRLN